VTVAPKKHSIGRLSYVGITSTPQESPPPHLIISQQTCLESDTECPPYPLEMGRYGDEADESWDDQDVMDEEDEDYEDEDYEDEDYEEDEEEEDYDEEDEDWDDEDEDWDDEDEDYEDDIYEDDEEE